MLYAVRIDVAIPRDLDPTERAETVAREKAYSQELQRSGEHSSFSLRGGVEYEWLPGRLRLRGGSYWEPGRFERVGGRLHGTFGIEVRVFEANVWGRRRGRITLTGDVAERYRNVGVSIGFWH